MEKREAIYLHSKLISSGRQVMQKRKEITTVINKDKNDHTSAEIREIKAGDKYITLISIENGGHTWPGTEDFNIGLPIGRTSKEIDFNEYMWEFFNKQ